MDASIPVGDGEINQYEKGNKMSIKRMLMLASMALAAIAFAAPAAASAEQTTFTDWNGTEHKHVGAGEEFSQAFEGFLKFTTPEIPIFGIKHSAYECEVTVKLTTSGPTTADVDQFNPTTDTCKGEGELQGCELDAHKTNLPGWEVNVTTHDMVVSNPGGNITIHNEYAGCETETSHLEFAEVTVTPHLDGEGTIETLTVHGVATNGVTTASGELHLHTDQQGKTIGLTGAE